MKVTRELILELAVWFSNSTSVQRIHLRDLGPPTFILGKPPHPLINNISAGGMALSFETSSPRQLDAFHSHLPLALVYFKIQDATGGHSSPLSFMAGYEVRRVQYLSGRMYLGMSLALDGVPHPEELVLDFVDARRYGIACLTKWCEDMDRQASHGECRRTFSGLRLDMLLNQLDIAMMELPGRAVCPDM
ncbi:hypothetical protein [Fundidesulfovibrio terrae]|uniref:hypothetical protein n=1 Tax=Fundidesulfovibrio terrae TaxID=2922866 RepID=UPI001FAF4D51|nr:hypothetical protein [Fundidesulfovibrio terrae]